MSSPRERDYFNHAPQARSRSSSAAARYTPQGGAYTAAPPHQPDPHLLGPHQMPFPPAGSPMHAEPPYPDDQLMSSPHMNMPVVPRRLSAAEVQFRRDSQSLYQDALRRPSYSGSTQDRRFSHDSRRSHHSHHSHHSRQEDRRRERDDEDDDDEDDSEEDRRPRRHSYRKHSSSEDIETYRQRQKDKGENVSRSLGGSLMSVLSPLKYLFEPRDKY